MNNIETKKAKVTIIYYPQDNGSYCVICPEIDRATCGDNLEDAKYMARELIEDYFEHPEENDWTHEDVIEAYNYGEKIIEEYLV